jgi:hypothetical protein
VLGLSYVKAEDVLIAKHFTDDTFTSLEGWTVMNAKGGNVNVLNTCSKYKIIGGYDKFGVKATMMKNFLLPPHYTLRLTMNFVKIDSWDNHAFLVYADDQTISSQRF